ncbi:hypothetical protein H632_c4041p0, partial [Helicosporidium sp. ATCC 50920]
MASVTCQNEAGAENAVQALGAKPTSGQRAKRSRRSSSQQAPLASLSVAEAQHLGRESRHRDDLSWALDSLESACSVTEAEQALEALLGACASTPQRASLARESL